MKLIETPIEGLVLLEPRIFSDSRGYFFESFSEREYKAITGQDIHFVQDNESLSCKGVIRGLHFQKEPHAQCKLVRVVRGAVQDIALDLRPGSPTFGQHHSVILTSQNKNMFLIPAGFAHGFLTLEDNTVFQYKCTDFYEPASEGGIRWNDPELAIEWSNPGCELIFSEKDLKAPSFAEFRKSIL